jgi:glutathione S-transferase
MKLRHSTTSPYVRKVSVVAIETGLAGRIEAVPTNPWDPDDDLPTDNPLGRVPALMTDDGEVLFDSPVICEYLDSLQDEPKLFPPSGQARWQALRHQALADGILDSAVSRFMETSRRPEELRWPSWDDRHREKIARALDHLEAHVEALSGAITIGQVAIGCALGYLDFRFAGEDWRRNRPRLAAWYAGFAKRSSMQQTVPRAS